MTGATAEDWAALVQQGLTEDLLPVVCNSKAKVSPSSSLTDVSRGKVPSVYNDRRLVVGVPGWVDKRTEKQEVREWAKQRDYGICVITRRVRAIDVDITDPTMAGQVEEVIERHVPDLPTRRRGNSSKFLKAVVIAGELPKRVLRTTNGAIEFLTTGQQFVAVGTHTSGARYEWDAGTPTDIPLMDLGTFEAMWAELRVKFSTEEVEGTISNKAEKLAQVHAADPVASALLERGLVRGTERDGRLHIYCPFEEHHTSEGTVTATTYWPAHTGGYESGHFKCLHAHCEHRTDQEFIDALDLPDVRDVFDDLQDEATEVTESDVEEGKKLRYVPVQAKQFATIAPTHWLIKNLLPQAGLGVLYAPPSAGKSFMALEMGFCIARGEPFNTLPTNKGAVLYVAAEGAQGVRRRAQAYAQDRAIDLADVPMYFIGGDTPNLTKANEVGDLIRTIRSIGGVVLVIIDTFAQSTPGANENSGEHMGVAMSNCKKINTLTGAMVMLVHHEGKDGSKGARGWSGIKAALDSEFQIVRQGGSRLLISTKQKDIDDAHEIGWRLHVVAIGQDEDGDPITSCVVRFDDKITGHNLDKDDPNAELHAILAKHKTTTGEDITIKQLAEKLKTRKFNVERKLKPLIESGDILIIRDRVVSGLVIDRADDFYDLGDEDE